MFPELKENLESRRFEEIEKIKTDLTSILDIFTLEAFQGTFKEMLERYSKCMEVR